MHSNTDLNGIESLWRWALNIKGLSLWTLDTALHSTPPCAFTTSQTGSWTNKFLKADKN